MTKIFSAIDPDALDRLREKSRPQTAEATRDKTASRARVPSAQGEETADDLLSAHNRLMLRQERVLQGLLAARDLFDRPAPADRKTAELNALMEGTRFQDEPVLKDYAKTLQTAVRDNDRAALDYLVLDFQNKLTNATRDRIIRENLSAASSLIPGDLLKDVVRAIRTEGLPDISITRQRVLDLLRTP